LHNYVEIWHTCRLDEYFFFFTFCESSFGALGPNQCQFFKIYYMTHPGNEQRPPVWNANILTVALQVSLKLT